MKVGFLKPDNTVEYMDYFAVEPYCKEEIRKYIDTEEKYLEFKNFGREYSYFTPYFDYVVFKMHYIQLHPFLKENCCGFGREDGFYVTEYNHLDYQSIISGTGAFYFLRSSDKNYNISQYNVVENGMIDVRGATLELFSEGDVDHNAWGHPGMSAMILNQYSIKYKEVAEDFENYLKGDNFNIYVMYLIERLGFSQITNRRSHGNVILNRNCSTKIQLQLAYAVHEYYGSQILPADIEPDIQNVEAQQKMLKLIWGEKCENKGF